MTKLIIFYICYFVLNIAILKVMYIPGLVSIVLWGLVAPIAAILYSTNFIKKNCLLKRELHNICLVLYF